MSENNPADDAVYKFILDQIDSIPHLEALLLLWNSRPQPWSVGNLAARLYLRPEATRNLLLDLRRKDLITEAGEAREGFVYQSRSVEKNQLIAAVDAAYRREVVRISTLVHSKPSPSVQEFARAFRFTKEKE